ncbi:hypothetical protein EAF04_002800 [Stromatinia cepivora]|nr:hypothetical protein EAF04_002800 [Stromatinia cepivora]
MNLPPSVAQGLRRLPGLTVGKLRQFLPLHESEYSNKPLLTLCYRKITNIAILVLLVLIIKIRLKCFYGLIKKKKQVEIIFDTMIKSDIAGILVQNREGPDIFATRISNASRFQLGSSSIYLPLSQSQIPSIILLLKLKSLIESLSYMIVVSIKTISITTQKVPTINKASTTLLHIITDLKKDFILII